MKVFIHNFAGRGNLGDDFILASELLNSPKHITYYFSNGTKNLQNSGILEEFKFKFKFVPYLSLSYLEKIKESDIIVFGGGQVIQDFRNPIFSMMGILFQVMILATFMNKPVVLYSVGMSNIKSFLGRMFVKYVLKRAIRIYFRDKYSIDNYRSLLGESEMQKVLLMNDSVFLFTKWKEVRGEGLGGNTYCIAKELYDANLISSFEKVGKFKSFSMDKSRDKVSSNGNTCLSEKTLKDVMFFFHSQGVVVTNRMHGAILAYIFSSAKIYLLNRDEKKLQNIAEVMGAPLINVTGDMTDYHLVRKDIETTPLYEAIKMFKVK